MTQLQQFFKDLNFDADRYFVGFDEFQNSMFDFAKSLGVTTNYPPFNIKKVDDNNYVLELAVAGFGKNDIKITMNDGVLTVTGESDFSTSAQESEEYLYKGIGSRMFNRLFKLSDTIEVKDAHLVNGMLKIYLENMRKVSEKLIPITDKNETTKPQMLNE